MGGLILNLCREVGQGRWFASVDPLSLLESLFLFFTVSHVLMFAKVVMEESGGSILEPLSLPLLLSLPLEA